MDDILPTFVSRYQLPTFPLPLFVSELEDPDLLPTFVSKYQLPLFVSGLEEPINFADDFNATPEVIHQSLESLNYMRSNNIELNDKLFELNTGSKATKRANQRRTRKRRKSKRANKPNVTQTKYKKTDASSEESQDNEITDYFSNLMAQVDACLQAELERIRNDNYGC